MFCRAGFAFSNESPGILSLRPGDIIQLMRLRKGWAKGRKLSDNSQGWAPLAYLEVVPKKDVDKSWEILSEEDSSSGSSGSEESGESGESGETGESEYSGEEDSGSGGSETAPAASGKGQRTANPVAARVSAQSVAALQNELRRAQEECSRLGLELEKRDRAARAEKDGKVEVVYSLDATEETELLRRQLRDMEARALAAETEARELRTALARLGASGPSAKPEPPPADAVLSLVDQALAGQGDDVFRDKVLAEVESAARASPAPVGLLERLSQQEKELSRFRTLLGAQLEVPQGLTMGDLLEQVSALKRDNLALSQRLGELQTLGLASRPPVAGMELLRRRRADLALHD